MRGQEFSGKFPRKFRKISGKFPVKYSVIRKREIHIAGRQNNILISSLWENNSTIIPDPPVEYLRKCIFHPIMRLFPTGFIYIQLDCDSISRNVIVLVRVSFYNIYIMLPIVVIGLNNRIR